MNVWRMSFRAGNSGPEMWPECFRRGIAAITYRPLAETDLSAYRSGEPKRLWAQLEPAQKASLRRVVYEMRPGDVIFAKQGPMIVGKGRVTGPYRFDGKLSLRDPFGTPWSHQVPVRWDPAFAPVHLLLGSEPLTVKLLSKSHVRRLGEAQAYDGDSPADEELAAFEGAKRRLFILHRTRERRLRAAKIAVFQRDHSGRLYCEVVGCGFDFQRVYGRVGAGYAQVHHLRPLGGSIRKAETHLSDLAVVCPNCHAMIHRSGACRSLREISVHLSQNGASSNKAPQRPGARDARSGR